MRTRLLMPVLEAPPKNKRQPRRALTNQADEPVWRLLSERPAHLVPPGFRDWEAVIGAGLSKTLSAIATEAGGKVDAFTWGSANRAGIKHPLSEALPGLCYTSRSTERTSARGCLSAPCCAAGLWGIRPVRGGAGTGEARVFSTCRPDRAAIRSRRTTTSGMMTG